MSWGMCLWRRYNSLFPSLFYHLPFSPFLSLCLGSSGCTVRNTVNKSHAIIEQHSRDGLFVSLTLGLSTPKREDLLPFLSICRFWHRNPAKCLVISVCSGKVGLTSSRNVIEISMRGRKGLANWYWWKGTQSSSLISSVRGRGPWAIVSEVSCSRYVGGCPLCVLGKRTMSFIIIWRALSSYSHFLLCLICTSALPTSSLIPLKYLSSAWGIILWEICFYHMGNDRTWNYTGPSGRIICSETEHTVIWPEKAYGKELWGFECGDENLVAS